ncbi:hypothetical protein PF005_g22711 [Phytophthora fragariae]|uniref:Uncharacterized protein n=1 Tax=Phytophthora fragariae TaxID=53985 RepID=A0A6A3QT66_9STRA|nr:hypothetical protein PF003_g18814 [Phytophthora fragariae]KAE8928057.1 hypothetical protein PF009_g21788 [Phytophthora fragariae]KAE9081245.1 hypothetical protein PF007_g22742 [Phytophthora fragariae]KAE9104586.1 hypothetical protein PF006_g21871 [Phytophthora fragariae]KAE9181882.1 hypothetical protein PF005_g22711 [Phytophthora fragariae]
MATCTQVGTGTRLACALLSLPDWVARPVTKPPQISGRVPQASASYHSQARITRDWPDNG